MFDPTIIGTSYKENWVTKPKLSYLPNISAFYKHYSLLLTHYTIQTRNDGKKENLPVSWKLEGSTDSFIWYELHSVNNSRDLIDDIHATYQVNCSGSFRHFKITMTLNTGHNTHFHLSKIEFFGTIYGITNPFLRPTCSFPLKNILLAPFLILFLTINE